MGQKDIKKGRGREEGRKEGKIKNEGGKREKRKGKKSTVREDKSKDSTCRLVNRELHGMIYLNQKGFSD